MALLPRITLTQAEAAYNVALFQEYQSTKMLQIGVYRSRVFIVVTQTTPWLERLKYYIQALLGMISYEPEAVAQLNKVSRNQWQPQREIDAKIQQLEAAQNLLMQAQLEIQLKTSQLQEAEQELEIHRKTNHDWIAANKNAQEVQEKYESLFKETQKREEEKNAKILQMQGELVQLKNANRDKQEEIDDLRRNLINSKREGRIHNPEVRVPLEIRVPAPYQTKVHPSSPKR